MGWGLGSIVAQEVYALVRDHIPEDKRRTVARGLIEIFEDHDCDTIDECEQLMADAEFEAYGRDVGREIVD